MRLSLLASALLPLLAIADSTTSLTSTVTSTATLTRTITVSQIHSVTSTYGMGNATSVLPTATGTVATTAASASASNTLPADYMGAASGLRAGRFVVGVSGAMVVVAMLM